MRKANRETLWVTVPEQPENCRSQVIELVSVTSMTLSTLCGIRSGRWADKPIAERCVCQPPSGFGRGQLQVLMRTFDRILPSGQAGRSSPTCSTMSAP